MSLWAPVILSLVEKVHIQMWMIENKTVLNYAINIIVVPLLRFFLVCFKL